MDYFSRKPDFPTFEDIYIARAQGAIELERRGDEVACRFGPDGPAFMLPQGATRGDIVRGCLACDGIVGALRENAGRVKGLYSEGDVIDAASDWQEDYLPCVCHRGGQGEDDRWEYEPAEDYRPFTRPADIPESIFDKLCASQGTTIEKVVNDPVTPFERSFREDIFNMPQNRPVGLAVLATLPLDAFLDASLSMICRGEGENVGTFTVKPGTYEPIFGIYDPVGGCGGTMGTVLDRDFEIDPHDISYTMMEPVRGEWKSDRIDLYTPQDCFGFSDPFGGRIEYSEKKPKAVVAVKPDPVELGHRASVAASSTAGGRARGAGIRQ